MSVVVGPEKQIFMAHERVLLRSSSFFTKTLTGEREESDNCTVNLPEVEPDMFAVYLHWLYSGVIAVRTIDDDIEDLELAKAYVLGNALEDTSFQNEVIEAIIEKNAMSMLNRDDWCFSGLGVKYIYDNTDESAKIRKLLVDLYVERCEGSWLQNSPHRHHLPSAFLVELSARLMDRPPRCDQPGGLSASDYAEY